VGLDRAARAEHPLLASLGKRLPADAIKAIPSLLTTVPDRHTALQRLDRYFSRVPWTLDAEDYSGNILHAALTVFGNSGFLSDVLLRYPELLRWAMLPENLYGVTPVGELRSELGAIRAGADDREAAQLLARFKRMHMLRIGLRDFLGLAPLADIALELSNLADAVLQGAHDHVRQHLVQRFGRPLCDADTGPIICYFVVLAVGKLGGAELNYSSDIDLMYLHTGDGFTWGPVKTTNHDFSKQVATRLTKVLSMMTAEGFSYRVDLRLRPEGNAGELVVPMAYAANYYFNRARDWELQMLIKARPVAGDLRLGQHFLDMVTPRIYQTTTDFSQIENLAESRDRIRQQRAKDRRTTINVKLDPGGIRDIEFLVQCLQRLYGGGDPFLRSGGTLFALTQLHEKGYISTPDHGRLSAAYHHLRTVEHRLQLQANQQTHTLPSQSDALRHLALQMYGSESGEQTVRLIDEIKGHFNAVSAVYDRVIQSRRRQQVAGMTPTQIASSETDSALKEVRHGGRDTADAISHTPLPLPDQLSSRLGGSSAKINLRRGERAFQHFLNSAVAQPDVIDCLQRHPRVIDCLTELMAHSPHFAAYVARFPEDVVELVGAAEGAEEGTAEKYHSRTLHPYIEELLSATASADDTAAGIRRFYRRQMLSIEARSVFRRELIFSTLLRSSDLAEWVIRAAYAIAIRDMAGDDHGGEGMQIVALGRLGMREFDLGSDADIVFIVPDGESSRLAHWARIANRIIDIVGSYTSDGQMFRMDTRLRPMGRDGELVQTEGHYLSYFAQKAEAWEALTYMKAKTIAGDVVEGKRFLTDLQRVAWHRFGLSDELSPLLVKMRMRLQKSQGEKQPIKSGAGGYYDIDFILMYLRLRDAGTFFESLNTLERISIIHSTGLLDDADRDALLNAATFFRALDHAIRVATGSSSSAPSAEQWERDVFSALLSRWSPIRHDGRPLAEVLDEVRVSTRMIFDRIFAE
jgi:glutamate-ammonia-ligase adenylyltransferase